MSSIICSITKKTDFRDTDLFKSLTGKELYIETNNNGGKGLSKFYNECIEKYKEKTSIIFCHDDVTFINTDIDIQVNRALNQFDVVGVAGCIEPRVVERNLWHWMPADKSKYRGLAGHPSSENSFFVTSFGPTPSRVTVIDGVFMAINVKKIIEKGIRFDEQFMFHHYDIDFSLNCNKNNIKIGVWPILLNHKSPGLREFNKSWEDSNQKFINKWKNN